MNAGPASETKALAQAKLVAIDAQVRDPSPLHRGVGEALQVSVDRRLSLRRAPSGVTGQRLSARATSSATAKSAVEPPISHTETTGAGTTSRLD